MRAKATTKPDRAPRVVPPIRHTVPWRVRTVKALPESHLRVTFIDGTRGDVDMRNFLSRPSVGGTLFEDLRDPSLFAKAKVVLGAVTWPHGADLAPDAMYDSIRERGLWVVE